MRILVLTSCTGEKAVSANNQLILSDFQQGPAHVTDRERELRDDMLQARDLYTGLQHQRLMRGIVAAEQAKIADIDLRILSAGYGIVAADRLLAPYETTFATMKTGDLRAWARQLGVPSAFRSLIREPYDLALILLGDDYLAACEIDESLTLGGPTLLLCGKAAAKKLPTLPLLHKVTLGNPEAKLFSCGLVGLKGELAARILEKISSDPSQIDKLIGEELLQTLSNTSTAPKTTRQAARANPNVDRVIEIPEPWHAKPHRSKLAYFIPEWDDLVDPDYDFDTDTHSGGGGDWSNEVYAHQMYPAPNYDGILISKVVAEKSKKKAERINSLGVHRFLRLPRSFPVMGDCGAFGYIRDEVPPYTTTEILDYYSRLDFDFGVSIDHFVLGDEQQKRFRYEITVNNAEEFIREHRAQGLAWTPIGAVQGWDEDSYVRAAKQYVAMGYKYLGLGAMVPRRTPEVLSITEAVRKSIPDDIQIHLFGVLRLPAVAEFLKAGANSADSAAWLRNAWMGTDKNYLTLNAQQYGAIRIPQANKSYRAKRMVSEGRATAEQVQHLDKACIDAMHAYDKGKISIEQAIEILYEYDQLITPDRPDNSAQLRRTLEAMPWKHCPCDICRKDGIDVIIFRGNNRNRRRGFHNTYAFYRLFQRAVDGEQIVISRLGDEESDKQTSLFDEVGLD